MIFHNQGETSNDLLEFLYNNIIIYDDNDMDEEEYDNDNDGYIFQYENKI